MEETSRVSMAALPKTLDFQKEAGPAHHADRVTARAALHVVPSETVDNVDHFVERDGMRFGEAERAVFELSHAHVGARLAQRWKFPEPLIAAIRDHHPEPLSPSVSNLSEVVAAANLVVNREGMAAGFDWTREPERWPVQALPPRVEEVVARVPGGFDALSAKARNFLGHVTAQPVRWYGGPSDGEEELQRNVA